MGKKSNNIDNKLNKKLKITFIIFLISGILALIIILNKFFSQYNYLLKNV